jgi:hypothetical protein
MRVEKGHPPGLGSAARVALPAFVDNWLDGIGTAESTRLAIRSSSSTAWSQPFSTAEPPRDGAPTAGCHRWLVSALNGRDG